MRFFYVLCSMFLLSGSSPQPQPFQSSFLPENDLHLEDSFMDSDMTKETFDSIIAEAQSIYAPIVSQFGAYLVIRGDFPNPTVNASAQQTLGNIYVVNMYGGLARRTEVTEDGFALVICHEIGHHIGGYPFVSALSFASNEGQSDYFATQACARLLWGDKDNSEFRYEIPPVAQDLCDEVWPTEKEQNLCYRSMLAGKSLASLLSALGGADAPEFDTPDDSVVDSTNRRHPKGQCRLDTFMAGALCDKEFDASIIPGKDLGFGRNNPEAEEIANSVSCARIDGFEHGVRPLCWYKPQLPLEADEEEEQDQEEQEEQEEEGDEPTDDKEKDILY